MDKKKTIMIILDGYDYSYVMRNLGNLPFLSSLREKGKLAALESVVPADSIPSWTTIYTGLNPAEHGVIESIDYLNFKKKVTGDYSVIKGKSFWDKLGEKGKKVFVFNPFMAYPAWDVNGLMISGPVFEGGNISTNHPEMVNLEELPPLGGLVDNPNDKTMPEFFKNNMKLTQDQFDAFDKYFSKGDYDFAFLGILTSDRMQHFLWKYNDPTDNWYKKGNRMEGSILKMYQLMETNVKKLYDKYEEEYNIVVISDHGHGRRVQKTFYVNQWLINEGIIPEKSKKKRFIEFSKNMTLKFLADIKKVEPGTRFFKQFKFAHKVKNADYVFSSNKSRVYAPKFDGCNPFGGICVNREAFESDAEYEKTRQKIIDDLVKVKDGNTQVVLWAKRREEIYEGAKVSNFPEIVYRMDPDYGVDRGLFGHKLFGINAMHEIISGGHKFEGIIFGSREDVSTVKSVLNMHSYIMGICE